MLDGITLPEVLMVVLTIVIAAAVGVQAKYTKQLADLSAQSEKRLRMRNEPRILIGHYIRSIGLPDEQISFKGFSITNASPFDVTITQFSMGLGIPADGRGPVQLAALPPHVNQHNGEQISDFSLPRRLQYGESMHVLYDEETVIAELGSEEEEDRTVRFRPQCQDSLGNRHAMNQWVSLGQEVYRRARRTGAWTHQRRGMARARRQERPKLGLVERTSRETVPYFIRRSP